MKIILPALIILTLAAFAQNGSAKPSILDLNVSETGCTALTEANLETLLEVATSFATDTSAGGERVQAGVPLVSSDSIVLHTDSLSCVNATAAYRAKRVAQGRPDVSINVSLAKLGSTGFYLGTGFVSQFPGGDFEFIVYDSGFHVVRTYIVVY